MASSSTMALPCSDAPLAGLCSLAAASVAFGLGQLFQRFQVLLEAPFH